MSRKKKVLLGGNAFWKVFIFGVKVKKKKKKSFWGFWNVKVRI